MNPRISNFLRGSDGGGPALPSTGRTMLAKLTSSLILDEGTGDPTWSRATKAWGFNELGYLEELASGCAFFGGARLVRNNVRTKSEDFSNAAWVKTALTVSGTNTIVCANATSQQYMRQTGATGIVNGMTFLISARVKYVSGGADFIQIFHHGSGFNNSYCNVNLQTGAVQVSGCTATVEAVTGGGFDVHVKAVASASGAFDDTFIALINSISDTRLQSFVGDGVKSFELLRVRSCDVTGYDASYVPEYVSVGVAAAPYFGAGMDGAKYYETDWQGAPIPTANLLGFRREVAATNPLLHCRDLTKWGGPGASSKVWQTPAAGSEVVSNWNFDSDLTDWTTTVGAGDTISASGGQLTIIFSGSVTSGFTNSSSLTIGTSYTMTIVASGTGSFKCTHVLSEITVIGAGTTTISFVADETEISFFRRNGTACNLVIDSISIRPSAIQPSKTATGIDGIPNTATTLTASANDATIMAARSLSSAARCASAYVRRRTGTGTISFTQDGGSSWTDITSLINSITWSRVEITSTLANPSVGFKISTSGDAIDVDCVQNEAGAVATSPIVTTTAAVTRNADSLTYQTAGNWSDTAGTAYIEVEPYQWSTGGLVGSATNGLLESASNSGATAYDGTNTANGPTGTPSGRKKLALRWTGATMDVSVGGVIGTAGIYDGAMGLASLGIAVNSSGYFGPSAVWNYAMTDDEFKALTT